MRPNAGPQRRNWLNPQGPYRLTKLAEAEQVRLHFKLYVYTRWQIQVHQRVNYLWRRRTYIYQPLVNPHLKLLSGILINEGRTVDCVFVGLRRQRHRSCRLASVAFDRIDYLFSRTVDDLIVIRSKLYPYFLIVFG